MTMEITHEILKFFEETKTFLEPEPGTRHNIKMRSNNRILFFHKEKWSLNIVQQSPEIVKTSKFFHIMSLSNLVEQKIAHFKQKKNRKSITKSFLKNMSIVIIILLRYIFSAICFSKSRHLTHHWVEVSATKDATCSCGDITRWKKNASCALHEELIHTH